MKSPVGAVVIGRNEGPRLRRALLSVISEADQVVYVDSGSADGSTDLARSLGVPVVELDAASPFTPARARNAGLRALLDIGPALPFVQFLDADTELASGWIAAAGAHLVENPRTAAVCGHLRERHPTGSLWSLLCDIEWEGPLGAIDSCGGNAMYRVDSLMRCGGFRPELAAGEEPELCYRLRAGGALVERIDVQMGVHDASPMKLVDWYRRSVRTGFAFAELAQLYQRDPRRPWRREHWRVWGWGIAWPVLCMLSLALSPFLGASLFAAYGGLTLLLFRRARRRGRRRGQSLAYAVFCVLSKLPQLQGCLHFHRLHLWNRRTPPPSQPKPSGFGSFSPPSIAYLVNQYPKASHSFVRREILALEAQGFSIARFALRHSTEELPDADDRAEQERTQTLLQAGPLSLLRATASCAASRPLRFAAALSLALRLGWRSERGLFRHVAYLAEAALLLRWLRDLSCEHLHVHFGTNPATVALLCRNLGGPRYSLTVHGPEEFDAPRSHALLEKARGAAFVAAVSDFGRSQLLRWVSPDCWRNIHVIRCGVDRSWLSPQSIPDVARLVCVGRLAEQKGHCVLVGAAARLARMGLPFELTLIGDGELRRQIEVQISRAGLEDRVRIAGWLDSKRVRDEILRARALVQPSLAEGLPVVLMEALGLGRPAISTYVAGIPELIENGRTGWLVPAGSSEELAYAMREALTTPVHRLEAMGQAGAARVARLHDASQEASRLGALIQNARCPDSLA